MDVIGVDIFGIDRLRNTRQHLTGNQCFSIDCDFQPECTIKGDFNRIDGSEFDIEDTRIRWNIFLCFRPQHRSFSIQIKNAECEIIRASQWISISIVQMTLITDLVWDFCV